MNGVGGRLLNQTTLMKYHRIAGFALALSACGTSTPPPSEAPARGEEAKAELTSRELGKLDAHLVQRLRMDGTDTLPVKVRFAQTPSDAQLADMLLTRVGAVVVGKVTLATLKELAARDDVEEISFFSGAGYDDPGGSS